MLTPIYKTIYHRTPYHVRSSNILCRLCTLMFSYGLAKTRHNGAFLEIQTFAALNSMY